MKYHILAFGAGFLLDQIFGDPYFLPHPIRGIGWLIAKTEKALRSGNPQEDSPEREAAERRQGKLLVVSVLLLTGMFTALILVGAYALYPRIGMVVEAVMTYQILAARCLQVESGNPVHQPVLMLFSLVQPVLALIVYSSFCSVIITFLTMSIFRLEKGNFSS